LQAPRHSAPPFTSARPGRSSDSAAGTSGNPAPTLAIRHSLLASACDAAVSQALRVPEDPQIEGRLRRALIKILLFLGLRTLPHRMLRRAATPQVGLSRRVSMIRKTLLALCTIAGAALVTEATAVPDLATSPTVGATNAPPTPCCWRPPYLSQDGLLDCPYWCTETPTCQGFVCETAVDGKCFRAIVAADCHTIHAYCACSHSGSELTPAKYDCTGPVACVPPQPGMGMCEITLNGTCDPVPVETCNGTECKSLCTMGGCP
jgi:hypothetical protein